MIGEVVDGPDDNLRRPVLDGIEYDYVFDVDIGDGEPIRKLPYNRSDNPYATADKWLLKENLPLSYRQQIVEFILQNSGQKDFTLDSSFRDPFTGSSAYIPGATSSMSAAVSAKPTFKHIPKKGVLVFDVAQFDGILKKLTESNNDKDTSHYHSSKLADVDIALLLKLLNSWPLPMIFPVVDILRMTVLQPDGATILLKHVQAENDVLSEIIKKVTTNPAIPANLLTSIRTILNAFSSCYSSPSKNLQLSYSTLILKVSRLGLAGDSQLQAARSNLTCQACWKVNSLLAGALQDKTGQLAIRLSRDWISRLSQAARSSREPPLFCRILTFHIPLHSSINTPITHD
uniref:Uncharacterized protein n=1 Tax=Quercus lobata TaxID=97700 RepID=A0A7N2N193_QUELO